MTEPTKTTITGRLVERGNGFSDVGDHVTDGGDLYRIERVYGGIQTSGHRGNWMHCEAIPADWDDVPEDWTSRCALDLPSGDED